MLFETVDDVRTSLEKLARDFEPGLLDGPGAVDLLARFAVIRRLTDGLIARTARRVEDTKAYERRNERDGATTCAALLGGSVSEARRMIGTAQTVESNTVVADALRDGQITVHQASMIADATTQAPDEAAELITRAADGLNALRDACQTVRASHETDQQRSARYRRSRSLRTWTASDGMVHGNFQLAPEFGGRIKTLIDNGVRRRFREHRHTGDHEPLDAYAADELCDLLLGTDHRHDAATVAEPTRRPPFAPQTATHIVIDFDVLVAGNHLPGKRCEIPGVGPVNVDWARNMLGDTFLTAVIKRGTDITTVVHFGRTINAKLRTALLVQGAECVVCGHRGYLEIDHHHDHAKGGPTSLHNLGPLCWICHTRKNRGWALSPPHTTTGRRTLKPPRNRDGPS